MPGSTKVKEQPKNTVSLMLVLEFEQKPSIEENAARTEYLLEVSFFSCSKSRQCPMRKER